MTQRNLIGRMIQSHDSYSALKIRSTALAREQYMSLAAFRNSAITSSCLCIFRLFHNLASVS